MTFRYLIIKLTNVGGWQIQNISIFFASIFLVQSCTKFVDVGLPFDKLVTKSVFDNDALATGAVTNMYTQMNGSGGPFYLERNTGLLSDEFRCFLNNADLTLLYKNAMNANGASFYANPSFPLIYSYIYRCNDVLEGLGNSAGVHRDVKQQLKGEANFIRAFWYFYLVNSYGDVPLTLSTDYNVNSLLPRTPKTQVYEQIVSDLRSAKNLLNSNYVDATDTIVSIDRIRPTTWAAAAMLARTYLYTKKYDSAEIEATNVLNQTDKFSLVSDLSQVFLANSNEAIWQLGIPQPATINTFEGLQYIFFTPPASGNVFLSDELLNSFETNDVRKSAWIDSFATTSATYYFPYKYQVYDNAHNPNNRLEYTMVLRLAEQYLIRAEARVLKSSPNIEGAVADLNAIRHRAGLTDYAGEMNSDALLTAILHERQVELFTEWGHRWFDLIRTNTINSVLGSPGNITQSKGGTWQPYKQLFPIDINEIKNDPNLTQTPGY